MSRFSAENTVKKTAAMPNPITGHVSIYRQRVVSGKTIPVQGHVSNGD
jgi:hypothetical protein